MSFSNSLRVYLSDEFFNIILINILKFKVTAVSKDKSANTAMRNDSFDKQKRIIQTCESDVFNYKSYRLSKTVRQLD
jgi:hypothetical protein